MLQQMIGFLREHPEAALFLCLAVGFVVGRIPFGPIQLGGVCGTLLAALVVGQVGVELSPIIKSYAFALFIFALGFAAGPQLFASLDRSAWRIAILSLSECCVVLACVLVAAWLLGLDPGSSAGLLAGGATESAVLGTASDALAHLDLSSDEIKRLQSNVVTVYSISYLCGLVTIVLFTGQIAPRLLRIDLREEAAKLWARLGGDAGGSHAIALLPSLVARRFRVERTDAPSVTQLEHTTQPPLTVERLARANEELTITPGLRVEQGDDLLVVGQRAAVIRASEGLGTELAAQVEGARSPLTREIVITRASLHTKPMRALQLLLEQHGDTALQIERVTRGGQALPMLPESSLRRGDVVRILGEAPDIARLAAHVGYLVPRSNVMDMQLLSGGIIVGYLLGLPHFALAGAEFSLGTGGGALVSGLVFGWLRTKYPSIGAIPDGASELLKNLGLATFIAAVGLAAGTHAIDVVRQYGFSLVLASTLVTLIPALVSLLIGRHLLKLAAPILLGGVAGQQCSTPAINTVVSAAGNSTPMLGYTVTYALSNVLLPLLGPLLVALVAR